MRLNNPSIDSSEDEYIQSMAKMDLAVNGPKEEPLEKLTLTIAKVIGEPLGKIANTVDRAIKLVMDL